ncbi:MAG: hypothetical protein JWN20_2018 [Jatrophihabitantaceae bacterium]|nr:hypothetical protein [Jatrophihabitantaceae bacterium]
MDRDEAMQFLAANHAGVLSTSRADGKPQLSPVTPGVDADGRVVISTRETAMKVRNLRRDPFASLCVFTDAFYGAWLQAEGTVQIIELPAAMEILVDLYRQVRGEHPDWDQFRQAMVDQRRVALRFAVDRIGPTVSG